MSMGEEHRRAGVFCPGLNVRPCSGQSGLRGRGDGWGGRGGGVGGGGGGGCEQHQMCLGSFLTSDRGDRRQDRPAEGLQPGRRARGAEVRVRGALRARTG